MALSELGKFTGNSKLLRCQEDQTCEHSVNSMVDRPLRTQGQRARPMGTERLGFLLKVFIPSDLVLGDDSEGTRLLPGLP